MEKGRETQCILSETPLAAAWCLVPMGVHWWGVVLFLCDHTMFFCVLCNLVGWLSLSCKDDCLPFIPVINHVNVGKPVG